MDDAHDGSYSRPPEIDDLVRICRALNEAQARYLLIGGFAVIAHGGGRTTKDIDFLVDDSPDNVARLKVALCILPDRAAADIAEQDIQHYGVVRVADEVVVDLLGKACGLTYGDLQPMAEIFEIDGVAIPVADKRSLIRTKATFRPQDAADRQLLEALIEEGER